jgi:pimeloyl-ACP methyl ester carboxylesterase
MLTVRVASLEIAYRREGEGPPLVLLHGAAPRVPQLVGI